MSRQAELAAQYDAARPRLTRVAYAVVGSRAEAEDVVSDCWLRLSEADTAPGGPVLDVEAWATTAVARRALDVLRSARVRRETYVGPWLPEPVVGPLPAEGGGDPADRVTLDETVGFALLVVLETLSPAERTAWVLHDVFAMPFPEVAAVVGRTPAAVRQLAARARAHVADGAPRVDVADSQHQSTVAAFTRAATSGDLAGLLRVLDPDVVLTSDGGGVVSAARRPVLGSDKVARFVLGVAERPHVQATLRPALVNGAPGLVAVAGDRVVLVVSLTTVAGRIHRLDLVMAPDKLALVSLPGDV